MRKIDDLKDFLQLFFVLIDDVYNEIIPSSIKIDIMFQIVNYQI